MRRMSRHARCTNCMSCRKVIVPLARNFNSSLSLFSQVFYVVDEFTKVYLLLT